MTLAAKRRALGRQIEALPTFDRMFLDLLLVAGETVPLFDGRVRILQCADCGVTLCRDARVGKGK
jgi:hypothetical protein